VDRAPSPDPSHPSPRRSSSRKDQRESASFHPERSTFEPLLVEYWHLEDHIVTSTWSDRMYARIFGHMNFQKEQEKIEVLWAFIEAHERISRNLPNLQRKFPEFYQRLQDVVAEAKHGLRILEENNPLCHQYARNFLVLRVILTMKLSSIEKFVREGWISTTDGEGLIEEIQERLYQVEYLMPYMGKLCQQERTLRGSVQRFSSSVVAAGQRLSMSGLGRQSISSDLHPRESALSGSSSITMQRSNSARENPSHRGSRSSFFSGNNSFIGSGSFIQGFSFFGRRSVVTETDSSVPARRDETPDLSDEASDIAVAEDCESQSAWASPVPQASTNSQKPIRRPPRDSSMNSRTSSSVVPVRRVTSMPANVSFDSSLPGNVPG